MNGVARAMNYAVCLEALLLFLAFSFYPFLSTLFPLLFEQVSPFLQYTKVYLYLRSHPSLALSVESTSVAWKKLQSRDAGKRAEGGGKI